MSYNTGRISLYLSKDEQRYFTELVKSHNVTPYAYLRAIVIDALVEEGYVARVQLGRAPGRSPIREASSRDSTQ